MSLRIIQISDLHLFNDPETIFRGVPMRAALDDVLSHIRHHHAEHDLLVVTGDIAHDEKKQTYELFQCHLGAGLTNFRLIPGNHDNRRYMREVFPGETGQESGTICFEEHLDGWALLGLDTHVPGELHGEVGSTHLQWLLAKLAGHADQRVVLFMHHPPVPVNSPWVDAIGLREREVFARVVTAFPNVEAIFTGHVHQEFCGRLDRIVVHTTPSVAVQFSPDTERLECAPVPPGYRIIDLSDAGVKTHVVRLPELKYPPDV